MKKQLLTAVLTVVFAGIVATGCSGKASDTTAIGGNHTEQTTQNLLAAADVTQGMTGGAVPSGTEITDPAEQTEKETVKGQTVPYEAQTDKNGETEPEDAEQQTKPSATQSTEKFGTTTTQPETAAPTKAPAQSTVDPTAPTQSETQAPVKAPAQSTVDPTAPAQSETQAPTKAPTQTTPKPTAPAQPETEAPTKAPTQTTPKPTTPAQPETQAPTKAPDTPKEKTMWDAPYDVEAIKAYMVAELKARGYINAEDFEAMNEWVKNSWGAELNYEEFKADLASINPLGEHSGAWDNFCTATAGPNRYYDNVNHCTVGHQHYNWSNPATGAGEKKNSEGLTSLEFYVNDALDYWIYMYGEGHMFPEDYREECKFPTFLIYTEKFEDGCVFFYIIAGI